MKKNQTLRLVLAALFVALGVLMPTLFHMVGMAGTVFSPMHIPVLLCGFICGWQYGGLVGLIVPILSSIFTGMPPLFPVAAGMAVELATYGVVSGALSRKLPIYPALIISMLVGRAALGIANTVFMGMAGKPYGFTAFLTSAFVTTLPAIILQLIVVPAIILLLKRAKLLERVY